MKVPQPPPVPAVPPVPPVPPVPAVAVRDASFRYDDGPVILADLSLSISAGIVTAILGPNGVGKTTLLNMILGWNRPRTGSVHLFGEPLSGMTRRDAGRTMSMVPQDEHVAFEYSLLDYVLLGRSPHLNALALPGEKDLHIAEGSLQRVGLLDRRFDPVTEISGGEKQLVLLARSLCQEPRLLLLDEPSAHLDLANKRRLVNLVHELRSDGVTIVLTTHDPDFAAMTSDEIILLSQGRLLTQGTPRGVMTSALLSRAFDLSLQVSWQDGHPHIIW
jgi:iron complex transport system ATP-binding protein